MSQKERWIAVYKSILGDLENQADKLSPCENNPIWLDSESVNSIMFVLGQTIERLENE